MLEWSQDGGVLERGEIVKFWITKYAVTQGIYEAEAEECLDIENKPMNMIRVQGGFGGTYYHGEGRNFHRTEAGAIKKALEMGNKKVKALHKQIETLEHQQAKLRNRQEEIGKKA